MSSVSLAIDIITATNIPLSNIESSQLSIKLTIFSKTNENNSIEITTLPRHGTQNPVWSCRRSLHAKKTDILFFQLYNKDKILSSITIKFSKVNIGKLTTLPFEFKSKKIQIKNESKLIFKIYYWNRLQKSKKNIIFIRHGESQWNEAQESKNIKNMFKQNDHPLNLEGIDQALNLNGLWKIVNIWKSKKTKNVDALKKKLAHWNMSVKDLDLFLEAELILCSPLTRATQTCLLTLMNHDTLTKNGIVLHRNLREIKTIGGKDTKSSIFGPDIKIKCIKDLIKTKSSLKENEKYFDSIEFNSFDVNSKWWTSLKDTKNDFDDRLNDFINYIKYDNSNVIICVGHSLWLKAFFSKYLPKFDDFQDFKQNTAPDKHVYSDTFIGMIADEIKAQHKAEKKKKKQEPPKTTKAVTRGHSPSIYDLKFDHKVSDNLRGYLDDCASSNVFTDMLKKMHEHIEKTDKLHNGLKNKKVKNAGCVKVLMNFNDSFEHGMEIDDVQLLFGTVLV